MTPRFNRMRFHMNNRTLSHKVEYTSRTYPTLPMVQDVATGLWYLDGVTTQTVTEQGKNLFDKNKATYGKYLNYQTGAIINNSTSFYSDYIRVSPSKQYIKNTLTSYLFFDINKTFISGVASGSSAPFTPPISAYYVVLNGDVPAQDALQLEEGLSATPHAPFVPNSPSPNYPSYPVNTYKAGDYQAVCGDKIWHITLDDDLRSAGGVKDRLWLDTRRRDIWVVKNVQDNKYTGAATESWMVNGSGANIFYYIYANVLYSEKDICSHYPYYLVAPDNTGIGIAALGTTATTKLIRIRPDLTLYPTITTFKAGLSNNNIIVYSKISQAVKRYQKVVEMKQITAANNLQIKSSINSNCTLGMFGDYKQESNYYSHSGASTQTVTADSPSWKYPSNIRHTSLDTANSSRNLLDISNTAGVGSIGGWSISNKKVITPVDSGWTFAFYLNKYFSEPSGRTIYLKKTVEVGRPRFIVRVYNGNKINISSSNISIGSNWTYNQHYQGYFINSSSTSFVMPQGVNYYTIGFCAADAINGNTQNIYSNIMVSYGDVPYSDYTDLLKFKITRGANIYEVTLPKYPKGIGTTTDKVFFDSVAEKGGFDEYIYENIFTGTESFVVSQGSTTDKPTEFRYLYTLPTGCRPPQLDTSTLVMCSHLKGVTANSTYLKSVPNSISGYGNDRLAIYIDNTQFPTVASLQSWLAAQYAAGTPVKSENIMSSPVRTTLTFTKVASSNCPELPMTFITSTPDPLYSSEIKNVANYDLVSSGENLFDGKIYGGQVVDDGTVVDGFPVYKVKHGTLKFWDFTGAPKTQYSILFDYKMDSTSIGSTYFQFVYSDGTTSAYTISPLKETIWTRKTVTSAANKTLIGFKQEYSNVGTTYIRKDTFMFNVGTTILPYEPFRGMQTTSFIQTLRVLPDGTRDFRVINHEDKTDKLFKKIDTITLNGSELWVAGSDNDIQPFNRFEMALPSKNNQAGNYINDTLLCTHFNQVGYLVPSIYPAIADRPGGGISIRVDKSISDVTAFKAWLTTQYTAETPVSVHYKLAQPQVIDLPYKALNTYFGTTNFYTITTILAPYLEGVFSILGY